MKNLVMLIVWISIVSSAEINSPDDPRIKFRNFGKIYLNPFNIEHYLASNIFGLDDFGQIWNFLPESPFRHHTLTSYSD